MGNRRKGDVWKYFIKVSENAHGKAKVSCTFCGCTYLENATRMSSHLLKCTGYLKLHNIYTLPEDDLTSVGSSSSYLANADRDFDSSNTKNEDSSTYNFPVPSQSPAGKRLHLQHDEEIRENIAKAIYASGLPLFALEDRRWMNIFKSLKPSFVLPNVNQLETSFLEKEYYRLKSEVDTRIYSSSYIGIKCKGSQHSDTNYIYVTTPSTYFYKTSKKPTVGNLEKDCEVLIDSLISEFGSEKVISIVVDSFSGILRGAKYIEKKYHHVAIYQCIYEIMTTLCDNLLASSVFNSLWSQLEDLHTFLKDLTNEKLPYAVQNYVWIFKKYDRFIFDYLVRIKQTMKEFLLTEWSVDKDEAGKQFFSDEQFWKSIEDVDKFLQPILTSVSKYKENPPPLNYVIPLFIHLQTHLDVSLAEGYWDQSQQAMLLDIFNECKKSVLHPVHFAVNFFDPLTKGNTLTLEQQMLATEYTYKLAVLFKNVNDEDCLVDMANYKANEGLWGTDYIWKAVRKLHPISWWNGFCSNTNLSKVAVRLFHLPSSATGGEGDVYSSYDSKETYLHTLSPSQKDMLIFVSTNLKLIDDYSDKDSTKSPDLPNFEEQRNSEKPMSLCIPKQEQELDTFEQENFKKLKFSHEL